MRLSLGKHIVLGRRGVRVSPPPKRSRPTPAGADVAKHGMDYLLTWNFKHIANATMRYKIERVCRLTGYEPPIICTPQELLEE